MRSKKKYSISERDLVKLHKAILSLEGKHENKKVDKLQISSFLVSSLEITNSGNPDFDVKRAILNTAGQFSASPDSLKNEVMLVENLNFNSNDFASLTGSLNTLLMSYKKAAVLNLSEVSKCKKVGDIINLFTVKIK